MRNVNITINCETRDAVFDKSFVGLTGENLQGKIIIDFCKIENFVDGTGYLEVSRKSGKVFIEMEKDLENHKYSLDILSSLLCGCEKMIYQFRVTQDADEQGNIPVFKSKEFIMPCLESVNATEEIGQQYPCWKDSVDEDIADLQENKEDKSNKASVINEDNKTSITEYASVKAVADYVDNAINETLNTPI